MKFVKRTLFASLVLIPTIFLLFTHYFLTAGFEWFIQACSSRYFGECLGYEKVYWKDDALVIVNPSLNQDQRFSADRLTFQCAFNSESYGFDFNVCAHKPVWQIDAARADWDGLKAFFEKTGLWIKINPTIKLDQGVIYWRSPNQDPAVMFFELEGNAKTGGRLDLRFLSGSSKAWGFKSIEGQLFIDDSMNASLSMDVQGDKGNQSQDFHVDGRFNLNPDQLLNATCRLTCQSAERTKGEVHARFLQPSFSTKQLEIDYKNLSYIDLSFLQSILRPFYPSVEKIEFQEGIFTGVIQADLSKQGVGLVEFKQAAIKNFRFNFIPWKLAGSCRAWQGKGAFDATAEECWASLNADFQIEDGQLKIEEERFRPYPFTSIETAVAIRQGAISHSLVKLKVGDLKGVADIEWGKEEKIVTVDLQGAVQDVKNCLPQPLRPGIEKNFHDHQLHISSQIKSKEGKWEIESAMRIQDLQGGQQEDLVHFGCEFKESDKSFYYPIGWFHAKRLSLEKYLSPFIFDEDKFHLTGTGEFKGSWTGRQVDVDYKAWRVRLENQDVLITIDPLSNSISHDLAGHHEFDLLAYTHQGCLPLKNGHCSAKNDPLSMTGIQGDLFFKDKSLSIESLEGMCQGIYLSGFLTLDYNRTPGAFRLDCHFPNFYGKLSGVQQLVRSFQPFSFLLRLPLDGDVEGREQGLTMTFDSLAQEEPWKFGVQGYLTNGALNLPDMNVSFQDIAVDFEYEHNSKKICFTDIQGICLVGKPKQTVEYVLSGHHVNFCPTVEQALDFDIGLYDKQQELIRGVGYTEPIDKIEMRVVFDPRLSHLSHFYPTVIELRMKQWADISRFHLRSAFSLDALLANLDPLVQLGFLSEKWRADIKRIQKAEGSFEVELSYEQALNELSYQIKGQAIKLNAWSYDRFRLKGKKINDRWAVEACELDKLSFYADLEQRQDKWKLDFLGLNYGSLLLLGLEGELNMEDRRLNAKVNLLKANLAFLNEWEPFISFATQYGLNGHLEGNGELTLEWPSSSPWFQIESDLQLKLNALSIRGCSFLVDRPFHCHFASDQGLEINGFKIGLTETANDEAYLIADVARYDFSSKTFHSPTLFLSIPCVHLEKTASRLAAYFPACISQKTASVLSTIKPEGELQAILSFYQTPYDYELKLKLNDGLYAYKKRRRDVKDFQVKLTPAYLEFTGSCHEERCFFNVLGQAAWPDLDHGQLKLQDGFSHRFLTIEWRDRSMEGFKIESINGRFCGLEFNLTEENQPVEPSSWVNLNGMVKIDFNRVCPLLKTSLAEKIADLELGFAYVAKGNWRLNPDETRSFLDAIYFKGELSGQETIVKGYQIQSIKLDLTYVPHRFHIQNLTIDDEAFQLTSQEAIAIKDDLTQNWLMFMPELIVKELKVGALRQPYSSAPSLFNELLIRRVHLNDFYADLNDAKTWRANGSLYFLNPSQRKTHCPLLAIPHEIILPLGLNPETLNPVTGMINFELIGDRFYLARFKDVYSEGRGSKFYLAKRSVSSWMDMKGNLDVKIKMKQCNPLFKIAELFTVSIQGNVQKPIYSLQKQTKGGLKAFP